MTQRLGFQLNIINLEKILIIFIEEYILRVHGFGLGAFITNFPQALLLDELNRFQAQLAGLIELLNNILGQFRRLAFIVHVHEEVYLIDACIEPFFDAAGPIVYAGKIGGVQAVAYKADKSLWHREAHVKHISSARSIGNDGADTQFAEPRIISFLQCCFLPIPRFYPPGKTRRHPGAGIQTIFVYRRPYRR